MINRSGLFLAVIVVIARVRVRTHSAEYTQTRPVSSDTSLAEVHLMTVLLPSNVQHLVKGLYAGSIPCSTDSYGFLSSH